MKKFTLIEADRYISIDNVGIFFPESNWPFPDIEELWAIQWRDNGTPEGEGEIEYDKPIPNTPATRSDIEKYVTHWQNEKNRQEEERKRIEEEQKRQSLSWQDAMRELEEQMEEMQKRHDESLQSMIEDHDKQMERVHQRVAEAHENLFYAADQLKDSIEESKDAFVPDYDNLTIFDSNIDSSLFDDSIDESHFNVEEIEDGDIIAKESFESERLLNQIDEFKDIDLSVLDTEFSLELLFEEDADEQVVDDIESLIAEIPDNDEPELDRE